MWSPDGQHIAFYSDGLIYILNVKTGEQVQTMQGHNAYTWRISWFPDGSRLLASDFNNSTKIWDIATGNEIANFQFADSLGGWLSADGSRFIINIWPNGPVKVFRIWQSQAELIQIARDCCLIRELTPEEREQFGLPPREETGSAPHPNMPSTALPIGFLAVIVILFAAPAIKQKKDTL